MEKVKNILLKEFGKILGKNDSIIITGSTMLRIKDKHSDYDVEIFTGDYNKFYRYFLAQGYIKKGERANADLTQKYGINNWIKVREYSKFKKLIPVECFIFTKALILYDPSDKFKKIQNKLKTESKRIIEKGLFEVYLNFNAELKDLDTLCPRKDKNAKLVIYFRKADIIKSLLQLAFLMEGKLYPYEKWLYREFCRLKNYNKLNKYIDKIINIKMEAEKVKEFRREMSKSVDNLMPRRAYVGRWWLYI